MIGAYPKPRQERRVDRYAWQPAFLWLPARLLDGRWAWLEKVERISYFAGEIPYRAPCTIAGMWCYRLRGGDNG